MTTWTDTPVCGSPGRATRGLFLFWTQVAVTCLAGLGRADIHVAVDGTDGSPGTHEQPVRTLAQALELARAVDGPGTIRVGAGTHRLTQTVRLTAEDSGVEGAPLTIRGVPGRETIISGGAEIPSPLFRSLVDSARLARLPEIARRHVVAASLVDRPSLHALFTASPNEYTRQPYAMLTWRGHTLQQARWPNRGYAYFDEVPEAGPTTRWGWDPAPYSYARPIGGRFTTKTEGLLPGDPGLDLAALEAEFDRTHDMTVAGYLSNDWYFQFEPVGRVHGDGAIQLLGPTRYGIGNPKLPLHRRFCLLNTLCHLDEPGEWYYDFGEKRLYLWPVQPPTDASPVRIAAGPELITAEGVKHVVLRDLVFENFGKEGVSFLDSDHILIGGCGFRSGIGRGLRIYGTHNTITGCDFHDVETAFSLGGRIENRLTLTPERNEATNNHIHHCRRRGYGLLSISGVGPRFANNLLHDQNGGMFYGDNDAVIELNEFYDMGFEMGDWNVAYNGADLTKQNNQVRQNFVHHLMETPRGYPVAGFRADDGGSGLCAHQNLLYKCGRSGFEFHGPANEITGNVLMETQHLWWTLQRPYEQVSREEYLAGQRKRDAEVRGTYVKEDLIGKAERLLGREFWKRDFVWTQRYPHLKEIFALTDWEHNPWMQGHCRIEGNFLWHGRSFPVHVHGHNEVNSPEALQTMLPKTSTYARSRTFEPAEVFVAPDELDFRLRPDARLPAEFPRIEFERIGLYLDDYRAQMPDKVAYRKAVARKYRGVKSHGGAYDLTEINRRHPRPSYLSEVDQ